MEVTFKSKIGFNQVFWTNFKGKVSKANCYSLHRYESINESASKTYYLIDTFAIPEEHCFKTRKECEEALKNNWFNYGK